MNYEKIDWGIRSFVRELNSKGFQTIFSCAGHDEDEVNVGYVVIKGYRKSHMEKLCSILSKHVINPRIKKGRLSWSDDENHQTMRVTDITFKAKNLTKSPGWNGR